METKKGEFHNANQVEVEDHEIALGVDAAISILSQKVGVGAVIYIQLKGFRKSCLNG